MRLSGLPVEEFVDGVLVCGRPVCILTFERGVRIPGDAREVPVANRRQQKKWDQEEPQSGEKQFGTVGQRKALSKESRIKILAHALQCRLMKKRKEFR